MNNVDWRNATPQQINLWKLVNGVIAWTTITPLYYQGLLAGSEFLTYNAGKLYIALEVVFDPQSGIQLAAGQVILYNMADAAMRYIGNRVSVWSVTDAAVRYNDNNANEKNVWFSRLAATNYFAMRFNGYRLNV